MIQKSDIEIGVVDNELRTADELEKLIRHVLEIGLVVQKVVIETVDLERVRSNGYAFQIELKFRAYRRGFSMVEIPILFTERDSGESKMSKKIVREAIWRVWWLKIQDIFRKL